MSEYPSLFRRLGILLYDTLIIISIIIMWGFITLAINMAMSGNIEQRNQLVQFLQYCGWIIIPFIYHYYFWRQNKPTVAMKTWKVRLNNLHNDYPPTPKQCLIRYWGGWVSFFAFGLGFLVLLAPKRQAWHDKWSHTELLITH